MFFRSIANLKFTPRGTPDWEILLCSILERRKRSCRLSFKRKCASLFSFYRHTISACYCIIHSKRLLRTLSLNQLFCCNCNILKMAYLQGRRNHVRARETFGHMSLAAEAGELFIPSKDGESLVISIKKIRKFSICPFLRVTS